MHFTNEEMTQTHQLGHTVSFDNNLVFDTQSYHNIGMKTMLNSSLNEV